MGDILHTLPAVNLLRQALPEATIGWVVEERWAELLCATSEPRSGPRSPRRPIVDRVHAVNTKEWRLAPFSPQTWERIAAALSELRAPQYQVAVDFQGAVRSALLARWSSAPVVLGARQPWERIASMLYTRQVAVAGMHVVEQNLSLAESIVQRTDATAEVELPSDAAAAQKMAEWLQSKGVTDFALLNPGAGWGAKQWPAERYGDVAKVLNEHGMKSLINFGPGEERLANEAARTSGGAAIPVECSLAQLIALTRRARLFIGGDTGPMHLAAALAVPVVAIFGPTDPARNGPYGTRSRVLRSAASTTSHSHRAGVDRGLLEITSAQVAAAAQDLLRTSCG